MNNSHIYFIQVLFVTGIAAGSQVLNFEDKLKWLHVARYTIYIVSIGAIPAVCRLVHCSVRQQPLAATQQAAAAARPYVLVYCASVLALLLAEQRIFQQDFVFLFLAYLVVRYPDMAESGEQTEQTGSQAGSSTGTVAKAKTQINYGVGMACSYFEGYLVHILPSDGHKFVGFEENIRTLEGGVNADVRPSTPDVHPTSPVRLTMGKSETNDSVNEAKDDTVKYGELKDVTVKIGEVKGEAVKYSDGIVRCGDIMACFYIEDYLMHILPSDGYEYVGFQENIRHLEDNEGVLFPVKRMFIVVTKSLYSPPDLKEFNRGTDVPYLETFNILAEVKKSVAGVKDRIYHNTAYKIYRPGSGPPVCLTVECASPLHTLYKVICNRRLYDELAEIDIEQVKNDFCNTLQSILNKSPECRGKCEFIFYDHEDPTLNLAELLLQRIREICPKFEEQILARRAQNIVLED